MSSTLQGRFARFVPADPTATKYYARFEKIIQHYPESGFTILACLNAGVVIGNMDPSEFEAGTSYCFLGKWQDDPQRGYRFVASTFTPHVRHTRASVVRYLVKTCEGIGEKTAERLWTTYGDQAVDVLRDEPRRASEEAKIPLEVALEAGCTLEDEKKYQGARIDLHGLFEGRGFSGKLIEHCIKRWGPKAAEIIKANPFRLMNMISVGFKRADKLYIDLGLNPLALKRQAICLVDLIQKSRDGHTWLSAHNLGEELHSKIPGSRVIKAIQLGLRAKLLAKWRDDDNKLWITTAGRAYAEREIAANVKRISAGGGNKWPIDSVPVSALEGDNLPSLHQVAELRKAVGGKVGLFCGGPGTGKSHTLGYLLRAVMTQYGANAIRVIAPTGKAAHRCTEVLSAAGVPIKGQTIHSLLIECGAMSLDSIDNDDQDGFGNVQGKIDADFIVVDESSMIDANLFALLLAAIPSQSHILFVGDPNQLPPVGHGSPLRDLITAGLPYGELSEVRRNAGQIVHACAAIKAGEPFETTERIDLDSIPPRNLRLIDCQESVIPDTLQALLGAMKKFHRVWETQVIIARNKQGDLSRRKLNVILQDLLNPDGNRIKGNPFRVGDKIICLRNGKLTAVEPVDDSIDPSYAGFDPNRGYVTKFALDPRGWGEGKDPIQVRVNNGELGKVIAVGAKVTIAEFAGKPHLVRIPVGKPPEDDNDQDDEAADRMSFDLGYAVTCHKLQGSQAKAIIVIADPQGGGIATREWWYTAISRAEKLCVIIGARDTVDKQRLRVSTVRRKTFLVETIAQLENAATVTDSGVKKDSAEDLNTLEPHDSI